MRAGLAVIVAWGLALGCSPGGETSADQCSNARDDDADGLIDCADLACRVYAFCSGSDGGRPDAGPVDALPRPDGARCGRTIDAVITLDVSSSMIAAIDRLRDDAPALLDALRALDADARLSLVVFVDDALAIRECAPIADADALRSELSLWREQAPQNRSPASMMLNQDCPENSLDAIWTALACPTWREGSARVILHATDDTFAESPAVLSGPFGGGIVVQHRYDETVDALVEADVRFAALARAGAGRACGATISPNVGRGFHEPYEAMASIPERTAGVAIDLDAWVAGSVDLASEVSALAEAACQ